MEKTECRINILVLFILIVFFVVVFNCIAEIKKEVAYSYSEPIDVSNQVLNEFVGQHREALMRHLSASADWRVTKHNGALIAFSRQKRINLPQISIGDFWAGLEGDAYFQTCIVIGLDPQNPPYVYWGKGGGDSTPAVAGSPPVQLKIRNPLPNRGHPGYSSCLNLSGTSIFLNIYEHASREERKFTRYALAMVNKELDILLEREQELSEKGYVKEIIPEESVIKSERAQIKIKDGSQPGIYKIDAYINPGVQGFASAKVFDTKTSAEVPTSKNMVEDPSLEFIGWSFDKESKFFYSSAEIVVFKGDWSHEYEARFEIWFHPIGGGLEQKLVETTRMIYGWQR